MLENVWKSHLGLKVLRNKLKTSLQDILRLVINEF